MSSQNGLNNVEKKYFKKVSKRNIRIEILELLKIFKFGLNISQIAKELKISRNTVKKYLAILEKESLIKVTEIGRSRICMLQKIIQKSKMDKLQDYFNDYIRAFYKAFDKIVSPLSSNLNDLIKNIGIEMSNNIIWPKIEISKDGKIALDQIASVALQHLEFINEFGNYIKAESVPTLDDNTKNSILLRVEFIGFNFGSTDFYYHLTAGFYEKKLQDNFGKKIYFNVHKIERKIPCCYFKLGIHE